MSNQLYDLMFQVLRDVIDKNRDRNEARAAYFDIMSNRNWTSPEFTTLVDQAILYFSMIEDSFPANAAVPDIAYEAAEEWVTMDLGDYVASDRYLSGRLSNEALREAKESAAAKYAALREMERFVEAQRYQRDRGAPRGGGGYRPDPRDRDRGGRSYNDSWRRETRDRQANTFGGGLTAVVRQQAEPVRPVSAREESRASSRLQPIAQTVGGQAAAPAAQAASSRLQPATVVVEQIDGPDYTKARPHDEFTIKGEIWRPAHISGWELDPKLHPFPTAYDINQKIRFHVKDQNGIVREEFLPMTSDLDYLRHEVLAGDQKTTRRGKSAPIYTRDGVIPHEAKPKPTPTKSIFDVLEIKDVKEELAAVSNLEEAELVTESERQANDVQITIRHATVYKPFMVDESTIEVMEDLVHSLNLTDAARQLIEGEAEMNVALFNHINGYMAHRITHALRYTYGIKGRIHSFVDDYKDMLEYLRSSKGEAWNRSFAQATRYLVSEGFNYIDQNDEAGKVYLSGLLGIPEEEVAEKVKAVIMQELFTIAAVNCRAGEFGLVIDENAQVIDKSNHPAFYSLIERIFEENAKSLQKIGRIYMRTKDGIRIELLQCAVNPDQYLVRLMV